ncbi:hypothetical protein D3C83_77590 [compost metagenome]
MLVKLRRLVPDRLAVHDDGVGHGAEDYDEDRDDDPHDQRVQIVDLVRDDGLRLLQVVAVGQRRIRDKARPCGRKRS